MRQDVARDRGRPVALLAEPDAVETMLARGILDVVAPEKDEQEVAPETT